MSALIQQQTLYIYQGDLTKADDAAGQALAIANELHDAVRAHAIVGNWGGSNYVAGDWKAAQSRYDEALQMAHRLGDRRHQAMWLLNLGLLQLQMGAYAVADSHLTTALMLARELNRSEAVITALTLLAELALVQGKHSAISPALQEAEALVEATQIRYRLPAICLVWAGYYYATNAYTQATIYTERAIALASEMKLQQEHGMGLRILGQIQLVQGYSPEALASFEQSLALLGGHPYETARTKVQLGLALRATDEPTQSSIHLQQAMETFIQLGAQRDLIAVQTLLAEH